MSRINSNLLSDTLQLVQLARESALAKGNQDQAKRLAPVVSELRGLANQATKTQLNPSKAHQTSNSPTSLNGSSTEHRPNGISRPSTPGSGILAQNDFRSLLDAAKGQKPIEQVQTMKSVLERNQIVLAMAKTDMNVVDIARQMGMTIDEVKMVVQINNKTNPGNEVIR